MEDIEDLLLQIEQEISNGRKAVFGAGVTVNGEVIFSLVDRIRAAVPDVIREARIIVQNSERRHQEEAARAQNMLQSAQNRADEILSNHEIIKQAEREAAAIRNQAIDFQNRVKSEVMNDISVLLSDTEAALLESVKIIQKAQINTKKDN